MSVYMDYLARGKGYKSYDDYLRSEHWQFFSKSIRRRKCFTCGDTSKLHVHHTTYDNLGAELPTDVVTLCETCHKEVHKRVREGAKLIDAHYDFDTERRYDTK